MFTYLAMISDADGVCQPTIDQIREDLGLYSTSMVFEALSALEDLCFIKRERQTLPGSRAKRNVYRRPPCEKTILRLLEREIIDGYLHPVGRSDLPAATESRELVVEGLRALLGSEFERYALAAPEAKRSVLMSILEAVLEGREDP